MRLNGPGQENRRLRYQILGPVELLGPSDSTRLGGPKQRAVLALLLLHANKVVPEQRFVSAVWGDEPPSSVRGQLQMYVSQLRKLIGEPVIIRRPPGYLIQVRPGELDLDVFDEQVRQARADLADGRTEDAVETFRAALGLWQGHALGGVTESLVDRAGPGLAERRLTVLEEYFDAQLAAGRHDVREIRAAAEENPLRERLQAQLMLALHGAGRTAEGLEVYTVARSRLVAERGTEPGPLLRDTQQRLLRTEDRAVPVPRQLPADAHAFTGRTAEMARLDTLVAERACPLVVVAGGAGVGKTTVAVHWAHRVAERFPDGQLYANLRGFDPSRNHAAPDDVVHGFLEALGVPAARIPAGAEERFARWRSLTAGKRLLVVLDNARDSDQVRPLLPSSPGSATVVTSRNQLSSLITVEGAAPVVLDLLPAGEARDLLTRRIGAVRVAREPEAVDEIAALCARLPLALAIVAARAVTKPSFPLSTLADELREAGGRLDAFDVGDSTTSVRTVFSWSYLALDEPAARLFRLLGSHPGPHVTVAAAASLLGEPERRARALLAGLARDHLIEESAPGRYCFHDLLRVYASELVSTVDSAAVRDAALRRLLDHYLHTASRADRLLRLQRPGPVEPGPVPDGVAVPEVRTDRQAIDWFMAEYAVLHAAVELAARHGLDRHVCRLADMLASTHWHGGARWLGTASIYETAVAAAERLDDPYELGHTHRAFAVFHLTHGRVAEAETELVAALVWFSEFGDCDLLADVHQGLGAVYARVGRHDDRLRHTETALELFRTTGNRIGVANSYSHLASCVTRLGEYERAVMLCKQALELFADLPEARKNEAATWDSLGHANLALGYHDEAIACYRQAVELHQQVHNRMDESGTHRALGDVHHERGALVEAREEWQLALDIAEDLHLPADELRARLARVD